MRLQDLLQSYPHFRLATEQDNQKILKFFRDIGMKTSQYSVRYDRGEDFFQFSKEQSRQSFLFLIENEEGEIKGTGSIILINHFYKNEKTTCAYLGDQPPILE
jgi:hypothetical protein